MGEVVEIPKPRPAAGKPLAPGDTVALAGRKVVVGLLERLTGHARRLGKAPADPEPVHDLRVTCRRMRVALRMFEGAFSSRETRQARRCLRDAGEALGRVRELDVTVADLRTRAAQSPDPAAVEELLGRLERRLGRARNRLAAYLDGRDWTRLVERLGGMAASACATAPSGRERLCNLVPWSVYAAYGAFREALATGGGPAGLHAARIRAKRLRYTVEAFVDVLGDGAPAMVEELRHVQDRLGAIQDAAFACRTAEPLATGTRSASDGERAAAAWYLEVRMAEQEALLLQAPDDLVRLESAEFRQRLAQAVAAV